MNDLIKKTITSMEVAEMVNKDHSKLLRDIRNYISQLGEAKIGFTDFFAEATYVTEQNKVLPCFQVTKKGFCPNCGFVMDSSKNNHCNACGQKLDWTGEE